jgi:hypothetical protein
MPDQVLLDATRLRQLQAEIGKLLQPGPAQPALSDTGIVVWEDDPYLSALDGVPPIGAQTVPATAVVDDLPLKFVIAGAQPPVGSYSTTTSEFRYLNAKAAVDRGVRFWCTALPPGTQWSSLTQPLQVSLDVSDPVTLNAFYARDTGLNFFHDLVSQTTIFSGESPDVVCHELGHAILDAVKPELFDAMSLEIAAFHEAFGDISSILSALQLPSVREAVLRQTGGVLNSNSRLSQLARQLGWGLRGKFGPGAADPDCLRNAANAFFYQDPSALPPTAPSSQLSSEPHSFSRVFSGAFLDLLAAMFQSGPQPRDGNSLQQVAGAAGQLLIEGVRLAAVGSGYYSQVAAGMLQADQTLNGGRNSAALSSSFVRRGILSPTSAVAVARDVRTSGGNKLALRTAVGGPESAARFLLFDGDNEGYKRTGANVPSLPIRPLRTHFGITLYVHMPSEPNRFAAAPAAVAGGTADSISREQDAQSFVEDLFQLNRIDAPPNVLPSELVLSGAPGFAGSKTHVLKLEEGLTVLKRRYFDCGFCRRRAL